MSQSQSGSFSQHQEAYAAWRERLKNGVKSNKLIDLTKAEPEPVLSNEWSTDQLFVAQADGDDELLGEAAG